MKKIIFATLLSLLGPGLGQIYNRDYKKGIVLIIISAMLFFLPFIWLIKKVQPLLSDPAKQPLNPEMLQSLVMEAIKGDRHILNLVSFVFLGIWAYAITQAYFKAKEISALDSEGE